MNLNLILSQARTAGLNVFHSYESDNDFDTARISYENRHLIVTTRWTGRTEEVYSAKLVEGDFQATVLPGFDNVDRFSGAHSYALLGWVFETIAEFAETKARRDWSEQQSVERNLKARAARRAQARQNRQFIRTHKWAA